MEEKVLYVWLNLNTGKFSNSWNQEMYDRTNPLEVGKEYNGWKLIKYTCLNDSEFEFMNKMKLR